MQLKIATTSNTIVYEGTIEQILLPTETGEVSVFRNHIPFVAKLVPWIIRIIPSMGGSSFKNTKSLSISKGIAFVDGSSVRITASIVSSAADQKIDTLRNNKSSLEQRLQKAKAAGSIEEINTLIYQLEKIKADIQLIETVG